MLNGLASGNLSEIFLNLSLAIGALALSISLHEAAHAWVADKLGDPTARAQGRVSLNPINHIDLFGTIILPLILILLQTGFLFGWAKPTPFNPWNLKNPRRDAALISLAGPASNFLLAALAGLGYRFFSFNLYTESIFLLLIILNLTLAFFNLIPIPPLDGFKVVTGVLPKSIAAQWAAMEQYGPILLLGLFFFGGYFITPILGFLVRLFLNIIAGG
ncbi:MAG: site-2 protease family protein [bacterium]|nr:site-2 protease family protein [bacterium]